MQTRKKFSAALWLFLLCVILVVYTSYAWITISRAPEVTGIETNIGANGSLEIALLNTESYMDPTRIRTAIGDSAMAQDIAASNLTWGNVIDLSPEEYGLQHISLRPSRLNVAADPEGGCSVSGNMLMTADFDTDGRVRLVSAQTVSAVCAEGDFTYHSDAQDYGVRAIGTISGMTPQQIALASARTAVPSYTAAALREAQTAWTENGAGLLDILQHRYALQDPLTTEKDLSILRSTGLRLQNSISYLDRALRQSILGIAAARIQDSEEFKGIQMMVGNTAIPLSVLTDAIGISLPSGIAERITKLEDMKLQVQTLILKCTQTDTVADSEELIRLLMDPDRALLGQERLSTSTAYQHLSDETVLTLPPDTGIWDGIAEYAGNISAFAQCSGFVVELKTAATGKPYLGQLSGQLNELEADGIASASENLNDIYGFAIDMAFRCNADSDLLLQTASAVRVSPTSNTPVVQGSGSYMRFSSPQLNIDQLIPLMDAIRIGFLDDRGTLLAAAKLNTSNYTEQEDGISAPLYLYDYTVNDSGAILTGERRSEDTAITALTRNMPQVLTVVVWLDGDYVTNSMVSTSDQSMTGTLNLQFAGSADLRPSDLPLKTPD